jgi:hypothetical protein
MSEPGEMFKQTKNAWRALSDEFELSGPQLGIISGRAKRFLAKMIEDVHQLPDASPDKKRSVLAELKDVVHWALEDAVRVDSQSTQVTGVSAVNAGHLAGLLSHQIHNIQKETQVIIDGFVHSADASQDFPDNRDRNL